MTPVRRGIALGLLAVTVACVVFAAYWAQDWRESRQFMAYWARTQR